MTAAKEIVIQSAIALLAAERAKDAREAIHLALQVVEELDRAVLDRKARAQPIKPRQALPVRARRVLEKLGFFKAGSEPSPTDLRGKICEAHLLGARSCGQAMVQQIAMWFRSHGEELPRECQLYRDNWLTSRCDEPQKT